MQCTYWTICYSNQTIKFCQLVKYNIRLKIIFLKKSYTKMCRTEKLFPEPEHMIQWTYHWINILNISTVCCVQSSGLLKYIDSSNPLPLYKGRGGGGGRGLCSLNLAIKVGMKYFGWGWTKRGLFRKGYSLLWHEIFIKKTKMLKMPSSFFFFEFLKEKGDSIDVVYVPNTEEHFW